MNLPNKLTVVRVCLIPVFLAFFYLEGVRNRFLWAFAVFVAASLTDLLDGKIARKRGLVTDFGILMDPLADKLLVMAAMVCLTRYTVPHLVVVIILAREFLVTSIRLLAAGKGAVLAADFSGKLKTAVQMVWVCYELLYVWVLETRPEGIALLIVPYAWLGWFHQVLTGLAAALTVISGAHYLYANRELLADR